MKMPDAGSLVVGQVVSTNLYNLGRGVVYAIHGEQKSSSVRSLSGVVSFRPAFNVDKFNGRDCCGHGH